MPIARDYSGKNVLSHEVLRQRDLKVLNTLSEAKMEASIASIHTRNSIYIIENPAPHLYEGTYILTVSPTLHNAKPLLVFQYGMEHEIMDYPKGTK